MLDVAHIYVYVYTLLHFTNKTVGNSCMQLYLRFKWVLGLDKLTLKVEMCFTTILKG